MGAGTKAPDIFCSVFSLTFGLGEEGPVLQPGATVRLHILQSLPLNPVSAWLNASPQEGGAVHI